MRLIDERLISLLTLQAEESPRRRQHHNLHHDYSDPCQRLLNALCADTYIRPHRHLADAKQETLVALRGVLGCIEFDAAGSVTTCERLTAGSDCQGVIIDPGEWHMIVCLTQTAVLLETKAGPFDPGQAKEPAPWAPAEGAPDAQLYLHGCRALF